MIDFSDIKKTLETYSFDDLEIMYEIRQKKSLQADEAICQKIIDETGLGDTLLLPYGPECAHKFRALMILFLNSKMPYLINYLVNLLNSHNYNNQNELIMAMQLFDNYMSQNISFELLRQALNALTTTESFNIISDRQMCLTTTYGQTDIQNAAKFMGIDELNPEERLHFCHYVTCSFLYRNPKLYGVYYYIPNHFAGHLEHSVLFDYEKNMVYDMANNTTVPLDFFLKIYPNYAFMIGGEEFINLNEQTLKKFNQPLSMITLEQTRRIRKKQG